MEQRIKLSALRLCKWDLIREHRLEQYEGAYQIRNFSEKMQYIVKLAKTRAIIQKCFKVFCEYRDEKMRWFRVMAMSYKLARSFVKLM